MATKYKTFPVVQGKNFYRLHNDSDDELIIARIEPHARQKAGDLITVMLTAEATHHKLYILPKSSLLWGTPPTTITPNIRMGVDGAAQRSDAGGKLSSWGMIIWGDSTPTDIPNQGVREWAQADKLLQFMWDGSDWIVTRYTALDIFS